eukprot:COSAG02_NODE_14170_length_1301_cov_1.476705_2_plen_127_part_01
MNVTSDPVQREWPRGAVVDNLHRWKRHRGIDAECWFGVLEKLHRLAEHFDAHTSLLDSLHIFLGLALCMLGIEPLRPDLYPLHHWLRFFLHLRPRKSPERITFSPQCIPFPSQRASRSYMQLLLARG